MIAINRTVHLKLKSYVAQLQPGSDPVILDKAEQLQKLYEQYRYQLTMLKDVIDSYRTLSNELRYCLRRDLIKQKHTAVFFHTNEDDLSE